MAEPEKACICCDKAESQVIWFVGAKENTALVCNEFIEDMIGVVIGNSDKYMKIRQFVRSPK